MNDLATPLAHRLMPRTPDLSATDAARLRASVRENFLRTFDCYTGLFDLLASDAAWYRKPISLRHPLIFYFGHTATFFINKLILARLIDQRLSPRFESLFAVGVDEMSWDDLDDGRHDWPAVAEVRDYRARVRALVLELIDSLPLQPPIDWQHPWWVIVMGIEHERIHLETSSVLIRQQSLELVRSHPAWQPGSTQGPAPDNVLLPVAGGDVRLGRERTEAAYGWDNEYGEQHERVADFEASRHLVSNGEYLAFVEDGGYTDARWWDTEGRAWQQYAGASHPTFWLPGDNGWQLRLLTTLMPLPANWPVEVNCHEARAFCTWLAARSGRPIRLPSEAEWLRLAEVSGVAEVSADTPAAAHLHLDREASPCPVDRHGHGDFFDVTGNVWQWTETPIHPFPGFQVHPLYDDFSTPTFDQQHNLLMGGSWISCGNESLLRSRYAFRRHFFQHAGFRYVASEAPVQVHHSHYETDRLLSEYAEFHYGDSCFGVPNFPQTLAQIALAASAGRPCRQALDLGCASGRASFELARGFGQVTGIDFSARFIGQGVQLAEEGVLRYTRIEEGELVSWQERSLAALGLADTSSRVAFYQGDACNLRPQFTGYDFILAANLIDRLYEPARFLAGIHERLQIGGLLMITSPYTWLEEHTPRAAWLGGIRRDGEVVTTLSALHEHLSAHFRLLQPAQDVPFVIRETRRKHQHTVAEVTIWERIR